MKKKNEKTRTWIYSTIHKLNIFMFTRMHTKHACTHKTRMHTQEMSPVDKFVYGKKVLYPIAKPFPIAKLISFYSRKRIKVPILTHFFHRMFWYCSKVNLNWSQNSFQKKIFTGFCRFLKFFLFQIVFSVVILMSTPGQV